MFSAYIAIQDVPSDWSIRPATGNFWLRSNTPILSSPRKPPWKTLRPSTSCRFTQPVKFIISLWNTRSRNSKSGAPRKRRIHAEHPPRRPGMHRRVDVAEGPLIRRQRPVRMHEPFMRQQQQLLLGKFRIDQRERHGLERQIPGCIPRILPGIRHRNDIAVVQVLPVAVADRSAVRAAASAATGRPPASAAHRNDKTVSTTACRPAPDAAPTWRPDRRMRSARRHRTRQLPRCERRTPRHDRRTDRLRAFRPSRAPAQPEHPPPACRQGQLHMGGAFGALPAVHRIGAAIHDKIVDAILERPSGVFEPYRRLRIGFVAAKQPAPHLRRYRKPPLRHPVVPRASPRQPDRLSRGFGIPGRQSHVLRAQRCGSTCSSAASGPRLSMVIRIRISSGVALAYSTITSK